MCQVAKRTLPPDGGYGWIVTFACALKKFISIPIVFQFGIVLKEGYEETNITQTQGNLALIWRQTIELVISLFGGPLLKRFGFRKIAVLGCILGFLALVLTSTATSFWQLLLYFTFILSIGEALAIPAFALGLNSYFEENRAKASGLVAFAAALGPILIPKLMDYLLSSLGWRYTVLTLGALYLHCLLAAFLLRPIKSHAKVQSTIEETVPLHNTTNTILSTSQSEKPTLIQQDGLHTMNGLTRFMSEKSLICNTNAGLNSVSSCPNIITNELQESSLLLLQIENGPIDRQNKINGVNKLQIEKKEIEEQKNKPKTKTKYIHNIIDFFDLTLLKDPVFVNIVFGLSVAQCAEVSYGLLLPSIFEDMLKLERSDITTILSLIAFSDLLFRLLGPFITNPWRKSPRLIYIITLLSNIMTKIAILNVSTFYGTVCVGLAMGITKGIRSVYLNVILPDYVPIDRLAYAMAIYRFIRGITIAGIGSIFLHIRNATGSFKISIATLNIFTFITIVLWTAEYLYFKTKKTANKNDTASDHS